ncbi:MAG: CD225/dispanin family protein [Lachnospiraceae bacterium]|nr:CD225/dispanin family protein [Lachnospiraceae bacterium]
MENMPSKTTYLVLTIVGFVFGLIWGILCISPYNKLKVAVDEGDVETAQANAKKIRTFVIIGIVLNILLFIGQMAGA